MEEGRQSTVPGHRCDVRESPDANPSPAIAWKSATFVGALTAGALWAVLLNTGKHRGVTTGDTGWFPHPVLIVAGIACTALAVVGAATIRLTHNSPAHTIGTALMISATIGPVVAMATRLIVVEALVLGGLLLTTQIRGRRLTSAESRTNWQRPISLLCGLLIGVQTVYLLWIFTALYAPVILALIAFAFTVPTRTRCFADGLLAAAAGTSTLLASYYALLTVIG